MQPTTLTQGQQFTDPAGRTGAVGFSAETGKALTPGQTTTLPQAPQLKPAGGGFTIPTDNITTENLARPVSKKDVFSYRNNLQSQFDNFLKQQQDYQRELSKAMKMSSEEEALTKELNTINQSERQGLLDTENKVIPMEFITGQQAAIAKQAAIKRLAASENLQAIQGKKNSLIDSIKTQLGFNQQNLENYLGLEKEFRSIDKEQKETSRQVLSDIIEFSQGATFEELDPEAQQGIINALADSPMTLGMVKTALTRNKVAYEEEMRKAGMAGLPASAQEYEYAKRNGWTGKGPESTWFTQYQTEDANRKAAIQNGSGLSGPMLTAFNSLADKQNKSPLIAALDRTVVLKDTIKKIKENPGDAAQQMNLSYAYIQALDTYQSAVREGELSNLNSIDSKIGSLQNSIQKMGQGQIVRPEVALQIAEAADTIIKSIEQGAISKKKQFAQQAKVQGLSDVWNRYMNGTEVSSGSGQSTGSDDALFAGEAWD